MGIVTTSDVRSTAPRYSLRSTPNTTIHAFRPETDEKEYLANPWMTYVWLCLKQTKVTFLPKKSPMKIQLRRGHLIQEKLSR